MTGGFTVNGRRDEQTAMIYVLNNYLKKQTLMMMMML